MVFIDGLIDGLIEWLIDLPIYILTECSGKLPVCVVSGIFCSFRFNDHSGRDFPAVGSSTSVPVHQCVVQDVLPCANRSPWRRYRADISGIPGVRRRLASAFIALQHRRCVRVKDQFPTRARIRNAACGCTVYIRDAKTERNCNVKTSLLAQTMHCYFDLLRTYCGFVV